MNPQLAPAGIVSDGCFLVPRVTDRSYTDILLDLCLKNGIYIIIPTIDTECSCWRIRKIILANVELKF